MICICSRRLIRKLIYRLEMLQRVKARVEWWAIACILTLLNSALERDTEEERAHSASWKFIKRTTFKNETSTLKVFNLRVWADRLVVDWSCGLMLSASLPCVPFQCALLPEREGTPSNQEVHMPPREYARIDNAPAHADHTLRASNDVMHQMLSASKRNQQLLRQCTQATSHQ